MNKRGPNRTLYLALIATLCFSIVSQAAIPNKSLFYFYNSKDAIASNSVTSSDEKPLDISAIKVVKPENELSQNEISKVIPTDMPATSDEDIVGRKIMDRSVQSLLSGGFFADKKLVEAAKTIENAVRQDITLGGDQKNPHKMKFEVHAFQREAALSYSGFLKADITYSTTTDLRVALRENLSQYTELVLDHEALTKTSRVTMKWDW